MDQINLIKSLIGKKLSLKINISLIKFSLSRLNWRRIKRQNIYVKEERQAIANPRN
jgi:hypothetical protein